MNFKTRLFAVLILFGLLLPFANLSVAEEKYEKTPDIFKVTVIAKERMQNKNKEYIAKEYLKTTNETVTQEICEIVDAFDEKYSVLLSGRATNKPKIYNRLDVEVNYGRSGESVLSNLIIARTTHRRQQKEVFFTTRNFDLKTGKRILLDDIFEASSDAWGIIEERAVLYFKNLFPNDVRNQKAIDKVLAKEALKEAEFTLNGAELTLHFNANDFFEKRTGVLHVRFFYKEFENMMTEEGKKYTDNRKWKMVALTFDDGPRGVNTNKFLHAIRKEGLRVTFFTVGKLYDENKALLHREYDANHLIASHSWNHWNGHGLKIPGRLKQVNKVQEYLLKELGETAKYFRAPVGTYPPWIEAKIGLPIIQWSVDTYDFKGRPASVTISNIKKNLKEGDIVLMHDTGSITHTAIPGIAEFLWNNGYMAVTVEELAKEHNVEPEPNKVYFRFYNGDYSERKDSNTN